MQNSRFQDVVQLLQRPPADQEPSLLKLYTTESANISAPTTSVSQAYDAVIQGILAHPWQRRLLDIGTCLGQDLRMLKRRGAPLPTLYGTDLFPGFEEVGHDLFRDGAAFRSHFFAGDILDESTTSPLERTKGHWDAVSASMFLHLFTLQEQRVIAVRMIRLLRPVKGSMLLGIVSGQLNAGEVHMKPPFVAGEEVAVVFRQSRETMKQLWEEAIEGLGEAKDSWHISCEYDLKDLAEMEKERRHKGDIRYFGGEELRRILFSVERLVTPSHGK